MACIKRPFAGLVVALMLLIQLTAAGSQGAIVVCQSGCQFATIQAAIDAAYPGDIIEVQSGNYSEKVIVTKNVTLRGLDTGKGKPVINAGEIGSAVTISADGVTLEGFVITKSGHCGCGNAGIRINSNNNTIRGNVVVDNKYGIYSGLTSGNLIYQNDFVNNDISALDSGTNQWTDSDGLLRIIKNILGHPGGNHYSDFDEPGEGCNDANGDGVCDMAHNITGGVNVDQKPLVSISI
ncbi:MAG: hypothetical protein GKC10_05700 [Methanosarcinales archaeon]|nr:hypothetical protein [Methanosarcinales archaeon]